MRRDDDPKEQLVPRRHARKARLAKSHANLRPYVIDDVRLRARRGRLAGRKHGHHRQRTEKSSTRLHHRFVLYHRRLGLSKKSRFRRSGVRDLEQDVIDVYEAAQERLGLVRDQWLAAGRPVLHTGTRGGLSPHPLLRALQAEEEHVLRLRGSVARTRMGRRWRCRSRSRARGRCVVSCRRRPETHAADRLLMRSSAASAGTKRADLIAG